MTVPADTWRLAPGVRWLDRHTLAGGVPYRLVTLTPRGSELVRGTLGTDAAAPVPALASVLDRLESAGLVLGPAPAPADHSDVTLVIPARSAPGPVRTLLARLPPDLPVIVVDDGSPTPLASDRPLTTVLRHEIPLGPAAARNAGAHRVDTGWIAFLDADTLPDRDWIAALRGRIEHAERTGGPVVLAAPRIHPLPGRGPAAWFEERVCALDLGGTPSDVGIGRPVSYVPSAALLVRTSAFRDVGGFDERMVVGEDVDFVWRLAPHGRLRYLPDVGVGHAPRGTLRAALRRRADYGRSAADLGRRHPGALRHVDVSLWSFGPWLVGLLVHPVAGLLAAAGTAAVAPWGMPTLSPRHARRLAVSGHLRAGGALGRWLVRPLWPAVLLLSVLFPRLGRRLLLSAAAGLGYLVALDVRAAAAKGEPVVPAAAGSLLARTLDDLAYGVGVWQGVLRLRTLEPVLPRVRDLPGWWRGHR
jgi:mycofactocin glycosyltransferase